jgi:hypothetical protein
LFQNEVVPEFPKCKNKCGGAPTCMNHKLMSVCTFIPCNISGKAFLRNSKYRAPFRHDGKKPVAILHGK